MKMPTRIVTRRSQQSGVVLVVGLILLIAMTLIGVTAMKLTTLDERIAFNTHMRAGTFQAAESALIEAADYDNVLECAATDCHCLPDEQTGAIDDAACITQSLARRSGYRVGESEGSGEENVEAATIPTVAGMTYERDVNIFGNSIGTATAVSGRLVHLRAIAGARLDSESAGKGADARHDLLVAPVGLRKNP